MHAGVSLTARRGTARRRWPLIVAAWPLVLGLLAVAAFAWSEYRCARLVAAEVAKLRAAGEPVDDPSMAVWFHGNSSQAGTAAWREILEAVQQLPIGGIVNSLPMVGSAEMPHDLPPGGPWPEEPVVAQFLNDVRPLVVQIDQTVQYPIPVWQPIAFDSVATPLNEAYTVYRVTRLMELEAAHALYQRDTERALRALTTMKAAAGAFDWDFCPVAELVAMRRWHEHGNAIRRSLAYSVWTPEQLDQLLTQVNEPPDVATSWRRACAGERAMALEVLQDHHDRGGLYPSGIRAFVRSPIRFKLPSTKLQYLENMAQAEQLATDDVGELVARAAAFQAATEAWTREALGPEFAPEIDLLAAGYLRAELNRRLTRTALGVKKYQLTEGRWPERLSDLAVVGLGPQDWTALDAGPFGYRVDADGALLWAYDPSDSSQTIAAQPPSESGEHVLNPHRSWHETRVR